MRYVAGGTVPVTATTVKQSTVILSSDPRSAGEARRFAARTLASWHVEVVQAAVELLVSELVTNALFHAAGPITVTLRVDGTHVRGEVLDRSPEVPVRRDRDTLTTRGRGLTVIDAYADSWGVERAEAGDGKSVWFQLALTGAPPPPEGDPASREVTVELDCGHALRVTFIPDASVLGAKAGCGECGQLSTVLGVGKFTRPPRQPGA